MSDERRHATRIVLNATTVVQPIDQPAVSLPPEVERVYERVTPNLDHVGVKFPGVVRDISVSGAFIACTPLPLLSRVALVFDLPGYGMVDAVAWILWRRIESVPVTDPTGIPATLPKGFGVLFESIPMEARIAIHHHVQERSK